MNCACSEASEPTISGFWHDVIFDIPFAIASSLLPGINKDIMDTSIINPSDQRSELNIWMFQRLLVAGHVKSKDESLNDALGELKTKLKG